jgi:hypothetical protein
MADQADLARELLGLAADDLMAARALVDVPAVSDVIVGFHAQQATVKAPLAAAGRDFPFTHNITLLMQSFSGHTDASRSRRATCPKNVIASCRKLLGDVVKSSVARQPGHVSGSQHRRIMPAREGP